ncbi:hypothetical protein FNQ90_20460 [Streptomyces alkaliphilus]|uniref:Uncharacterized protein n=1 Tax=Streptomyces alkaliphilus TaxID=1472722 RepID=A0A7W3Y3B0_9ACTN|nr:hypothetical protein [Streptomyces alkaliphilus]MBB0246418.1 hypothetical protein [Streptomyces alkaliphilus]
MTTRLRTLARRHLPAVLALLIGLAAGIATTETLLHTGLDRLPAMLLGMAAVVAAHRLATAGIASRTRCPGETVCATCGMCPECRNAFPAP